MYQGYRLALPGAQPFERFGKTGLHQREAVAWGFREHRSGPAK